jgi:predicted site-specific integrase-resolvase
LSKQHEAQKVSSPAERNAYRIREFCQSIGISQATFFKHQAAGKIKTIRIGRRRLIPAAEALRISTEGLN